MPVYTRPGLACGINLLAQVGEKTYGRATVKSYNDIVDRAKTNRDRVLMYKPLESSTLRIGGYADAAFATNADHSSQIGYIILLCDASSNAHVLSFSSHNSRLVVRSVTAGEVFTFTAYLDEASILRYDLKQL